MIREVTETLVDVIQAATLDLNDWVRPVSLHDDANDPTNRLALFLYAIDEHGHVRNRPMEFDGERYRRPPVVMRLSYLMAYYGNQTDLAHLDEQARLDRVIQVFHDQPILDASLMPASLAATVDKLTVRLWSPSTDERNQIWTALGRAMRLALYYKVDAVPIVPTRADGGPPIVEQQIDYGELVSS